MKVIVLAGLLLVVTVSASTFVNDVVRSEWSAYKLEHNKTYEVYGEDKYRLSVYLKNRKIISAHNALYYQGKTSYLMGVNQFSDLTHEEFVQTVLSPIDVNTTSFDEDEFIPEYMYEDSGENLESFDWRSRGAVTPVKNQRQCGSCWAFSTTGAVESSHFIKNHQLVSLSEQNLVDCNRQNHGCGGGYMPYAFEYVRTHGLHRENEYPYEAAQHTCRDRGGNKITIKQYGKVRQDEEALRQVVEKIAPVSVGIDASGFQHYHGHVLDYPQCSHKLNHGVLVVGFGNQDGKDFWLVKNSWGTGFGEGGYVKMARNRNNQCGITLLSTVVL